MAGQGVSPAQASGSRRRPTICRTRSAASAQGISAAVTYSGRAEGPRRTAMAWVSVRRGALATPITGTPNCSRTRAPSPGRGNDRAVPGHRALREFRALLYA